MIKFSFAVLIAILSFSAISCLRKSEAVESQVILDYNLNSHAIQPTPTISNQVEWRSAVFYSIKVGADTRIRVLSIFGEPIWTGTPFDESGARDVEDLIRDEFDSKDGFHSRLAVTSRREDGVVILIEGSLSRIPVKDVLDRFGSNFQRKKFGTLLCDSQNPDSEILVEKDDAYSSTYYIYPELGIVIPTSDDKFVNTIEYRSDPLSGSRQSCKED